MGISSSEYGTAIKDCVEQVTTDKNYRMTFQCGNAVTHWKKLEVNLTQNWLPQLEDLGLYHLPLLPQCMVIALVRQSSNMA